MQGHPELPAAPSPAAAACTRVDYFAAATSEAAATTAVSPLGARPLGPEAQVALTLT